MHLLPELWGGHRSAVVQRQVRKDGRVQAAGLGPEEVVALAGSPSQVVCQGRVCCGSAPIHLRVHQAALPEAVLPCVASNT
jgi:hypothetical protein